MKDYNFKSFQYRAANAGTVEEKKAINEELKTLYVSLPQAEKEAFNIQLNNFLKQEEKRLGEDYRALNNQLQSN